MATYLDAVRVQGYGDTRLLELAAMADDAEQDMERAYAIVEAAQHQDELRKASAFMLYEERAKAFQVMDARVENRMKYLDSRADAVRD